MKKVEFCYRQGDVYIFRVDAFPKGTRKQDALTEKKQVALGEISGHNHCFDSNAAVDIFKMEGYDGITFLDIKEETAMKHGRIEGFKGKEADQDYHWDMLIAPGQYITGIVEETDWITKQVRKVVD